MFNSQFDLSRAQGFDYDGFLKRCEKKSKIIQKYFKNENSEIYFNISLKPTNKTQYQIEISLKSKDLNLTVNKINFIPEKTLESTFNLFKKKLLEALAKLKEKDNQSLGKSSLSYSRIDKDLKKFVAKDRKDEFTKRLLPILTKTKNYLQRFLQFAIFNNVVKKGDIAIDDLLNEVVMNAYDNYTRKPQHQTLERWLYVLADQVLQKYLSQEYIFNELNVSFPEEKLKDEIFQIALDAEGQPQLLEDFYQPVTERNNNLFLEFGVDLDTFNSKKKGFSHKMLKALNHLIPNERTILELYIVENFSFTDIADIKNMKIQHIRQSIKKSLEILQKYYA